MSATNFTTYTNLPQGQKANNSTTATELGLVLKTRDSESPRRINPKEGGMCGLALTGILVICIMIWHSNHKVRHH